MRQKADAAKSLLGGPVKRREGIKARRRI